MYMVVLTLELAGGHRRMAGASTKIILRRNSHLFLPQFARRFGSFSEPCVCVVDCAKKK